MENLSVLDVADYMKSFKISEVTIDYFKRR